MNIQPDKIKHFIAGFVIALVVGIAFLIAGVPATGAALAGLAAAIIAGLIKEAVDEYKKRTNQGGTGWDWLDLAATVGGGAAGAIMINAIRRGII